MIKYRIIFERINTYTTGEVVFIEIYDEKLYTLIDDTKHICQNAIYFPDDPHKTWFSSLIHSHIIIQNRIQKLKELND